MSLQGVTVGVVCMYYWPEQSGSAPYVTGMAEHYASLGADVTVIAGMPHYPQWRVMPAYEGRWTSTDHRNGVVIHRSRSYVPVRQGALRRAGYEASWMLGQLPRALATKADVIVASSPPLGAAWLATAMGRRTGAPVGVVVQDFYGNAAAQSGVAGAAAVSGRIAAVESRLLSSMDLVGVIDENFVPTAQSLGVATDRIRTLPNWTHIAPPRSDRAHTRRRLGWKETDFVVLHTGNMGHKQGLENVLEAAELTAGEDPSCSFVLMGDGNRRAALEEMGRGLPTLHITDPVSDEDYPDVLNAADALLVNERPEAVEMSLPSKITSYLGTDRPIIAAVPDGVTRRYLSRLGTAAMVPAGSPHDLAETVRKMAVSGPPVNGTVDTRAADKQEALARYEQFAHELLDRRAG